MVIRGLAVRKVRAVDAVPFWPYSLRHGTGVSTNFARCWTRTRSATASTCTAAASTVPTRNSCGPSTGRTRMIPTARTWARASGFVAQAVPRLRSGGRGVHQISNILIELHGDAAAVESQLPRPADERRRADAGNLPVWPLPGPLRAARRAMAHRGAHGGLRLDRGAHARRTGAEDTDLFAKRRPTGSRSTSDPVYSFLERVRRRP